LPVSGDDPAAKAIVSQLVDEAGFDPVDAGGLDDSWRQQPGSPAYCTDLGAEDMRKSIPSHQGAETGIVWHPFERGRTKSGAGDADRILSEPRPCHSDSDGSEPVD